MECSLIKYVIIYLLIKTLQKIITPFNNVTARTLLKMASFIVVLPTAQDLTRPTQTRAHLIDPNSYDLLPSLSRVPRKAEAMLEK